MAFAVAATDPLVAGGKALVDLGDKAVLIASGGGGGFSFLPLPIAFATVAPNDLDLALGKNPDVPGLDSDFLFDASGVLEFEAAG